MTPRLAIVCTRKHVFFCTIFLLKTIRCNSFQLQLQLREQIVVVVGLLWLPQTDDDDDEISRGNVTAGCFLLPIYT